MAYDTTGIIIMVSDWSIDNDMHMKKCSDWLTYDIIGIIMTGSKVGMALNRCPLVVNLIM